MSESRTVSGRVPAAEPLTVIRSGGGTGGHLYPALALADALTARRPDLVPIFVGSERGLEARVLPARGVRHHLLPVEGFQRGGGSGVARLAANVRVAGRLLGAMTELAGRFDSLRPALVVVTGGYAGGPAGILAMLLGVPLVLQEQNSVPGLTTRLLSLRARQIHLAFPEARERLPRVVRSRARITGNPVHPPEAVDLVAARTLFNLEPDRPLVLVVGGSQGSRALNQAVMKMVTAVTPGGLPGGAQLLWATGPSHVLEVRAALDAAGDPAWVRAVGYIDAMPMALALAEVAVSRAGAMGTSEFLAWGIPSILVPLPTAAADHQAANARALAEAGAAILVSEAQLTGEGLAETLRALLGDPMALAGMAAAARLRGRPSAAVDIADQVARLLPPPWPRAVAS
ncbi:undecaprenyldiphospho-muramoylpentapeptide beta-N-acetylglucosaminyltransferase [soil metagenome]